MFKNHLRAALFLGIFALVVFAGAAPSEAQCYCYNGASCGVNLPPFPCGGSVCGNDHHMYKCSSGSWIYQNTTCSCSVTPGGEEEAMASPANAPLVESLFAQLMSIDPAQAQPAVTGSVAEPATE